MIAQVSMSMLVSLDLPHQLQTREMAEQIAAEAKYMKALKHDNILKCFAVITESYGSCKEFLLLLELCPGTANISARIVVRITRIRWNIV